MKIFSNLLLMAAFVLVAAHVFAQNNTCESSYYPFKKGVSLELTHYDKKGKATGTSTQTVREIEEVPGGFKANVEMNSADAKGKNPQTANFDVECNGNGILVDMRSVMNPNAMAGMKDMEMEISGNALEFPNELAVGQTLPDGSLNMKASMNGLALMNMNFFITNRKVEGTETITTPAGTFDCVKMSQETEIKTVIKLKFYTTTWYAKGVGMVKTENYDKSGKLEGSSMLTKLER